MSKNKLTFSEQLLKDKGFIQQPDGSWMSAKTIKKSDAKLFCKGHEKYVAHNDTIFEFGYSRSPKATFTVNPIGKPRMTQRDKWDKRKNVQSYWKYKEEILRQAEKQQFALPINDFHAIFVIQMPDSWTEKKKNQMCGSPHQQKPDVDNILKGLMDALLNEDSAVYDCRITKYWGRYGRIIIY